MDAVDEYIPTPARAIELPLPAARIVLLTKPRLSARGGTLSRPGPGGGGAVHVEGAPPDDEVRRAADPSPLPGWAVT